MGLALSFLALDVFWKRPTPWSAAFLGLANALAMSGKYIGVVVLLFSLPVVFARRDPRWLLARWFALGWLVPLILVNLSLLRHFSTFESGLSREVDGATRGHRGLGREVPHIYYFLRMPFMTPWGLWAGLIAATAAVAWRWKRITVPQWAAIAFPIFFLCLLSFSPKTAGRYLLPVEAFAVLLAGTGMAMLIQSGAALRWPWKAVAVAGASVALIAAMSTWTMFGVYWNEFATDSRADLRQWITANLPAEAIIAQDDRVDLEADPSWRSRKVLSSEYAADVGSIEELRRRGVTHVAITTQIYNRFLDESIRPTEEARPNFERRAAFYKRILNSGNPVWEQKSGLVIYLHPTLRLFELPSK
jgi:hypothetical protein